MDRFDQTIRNFLPDEPYRRLTGDELWARVRDHDDPAAFRVLLERVGNTVYLRYLAVLSSPTLAEDAAQDTLRKLVRHRTRLATHAGMLGWLYQTASTTAKDLRRKRRRIAFHEPNAPAVRPVPDPAAVAVVSDLVVAVNAALVELPARERRALEFVYLEGMTHAEAATALGWSKGALSSCVSRGWPGSA